MPSSSNSHAADVCELTLAYLLNNCRFHSPHEASEYTAKLGLLLPAEVSAQRGRAAAMVPVLWTHVLPRWIVRAHWVSRPGDLTALTHLLVDSKRNPADVAVLLSDNTWLGVSIKSSAARDVPFKNPGFGPIDSALNLGLRAWLDGHVREVVTQYGLPVNAEARKRAIRAHPAIADATRTYGDRVLTGIRDALLTALRRCSGDDLRYHLEHHWLDSGVCIPPYVKITGSGVRAPFEARLLKPDDNPLVQGIRQGRLTLEALGDNSIGIRADGITPLMRLRVKFESEKLASPVKFSAEVWRAKSCGG